MTNNRAGHRGYVFSRPFFEHRVPQHVQNLVIRDYCQQNGFTYLLSGTEYAMEGCHMVLREIVQDVDNLAGIVMYSIFMLPGNRRARHAIYETILKSGATLHAAVEGLTVASTADIDMVEDIWLMQQCIRRHGAPQGLGAILNG
ncbi:MAG: LIC12192 family sporadic carbohydrate cluster protein [Rhodospirillales bacterium]